MHRILIVDDDSLVRFTIVAMVEDAGYDVVQATNAAEAIAVLESDSDIRVVITDVSMPGDMDGVTLAHFVRDRWPPVRLIVISARSLPRDLPSAAEFLAKPFLPVDLTSRLGEMRF